MFIHLKSTDNVNLFPKNNVLFFTVKLPERIILNSNGSRRGWKCALIDIEISNPPTLVFEGTSDKPNTVYIGTDIVDTSYTAFGQVQILRKLSMNEIMGNITSEVPKVAPNVFGDGVVQCQPIFTVKNSSDITTMCRQTCVHPHGIYSGEVQQKTAFIKEFSPEYIPVKSPSFSTIQIFLKGDDWRSLALADNSNTENSYLYAVLHLTYSNND